MDKDCTSSLAKRNLQIMLMPNSKMDADRTNSFAERNMKHLLMLIVSTMDKMRSAVEYRDLRLVLALKSFIRKIVCSAWQARLYRDQGIIARENALVVPDDRECMKRLLFEYHKLFGSLTMSKRNRNSVDPTIEFEWLESQEEGMNYEGYSCSHSSEDDIQERVEFWERLCESSIPEF